uniref:Uncharacterized protein n=1 Tax=Cyanothece sp. (strain PCC 7425 / ATCC 29141) TaxID=395961 RepID=B8HTY7_CYAP4
MDLQNLLPHQTHPIQRTTTGQLPAELAELSEIQLFYCSSPVLPSDELYCRGENFLCSYEGDETE